MQFSLKIHKNPARKQWAECLERPKLERLEVDQAVSEVLTQVRAQGDQALRELTLRFSDCELEELEVSREERAEAEASLSQDLRKAIDQACHSIEKFHAAQQVQAQVIDTLTGVKCWHRSTPIEKVGLYVPTGKAPAISAVLMLGLPARIAGCQEIILCTSAQGNGKVHPAILYAAKLAGVTRIFKVGGAQAIAAMAYGTESLPKVYKIFGSGNAYVMSAKHSVSREGVAIDLPAGQPELLLVGDDTAKAPLLAADLLAQAAQGQAAHVLVLSLDKELPKLINQALEEQAKNLSAQEQSIAAEALKKGAILCLKSREEVLDIINNHAPEQVALHIKNANELAQQIRNAGTVCLGPYSSPSAGDYLTGANNHLPGQGFARAYGGLSLDDYLKKISFQQVSAQGFEALYQAAHTLALEEAQTARAQALEIRKNKS